MTVMIQSQTFKTFESLIKKLTTTLAEEYKEVGWFMQGSEFQTFDSPKNLKRSGPVGSNAVKVAPLATRQVNDKDFDGVIRLDGRLFRSDMFEKNVLATARESNWGAGQWKGFLAFMKDEARNARYCMATRQWTWPS